MHSTGEIAEYYIVEILILLCILGNVIKECLIGFYDTNEQKLETVV